MGSQRSTDPRELEARRLRAIRALQQGYTQRETGLLVGASRTSIANWARNYRCEGEAGLQARRRGRPPFRSMDPNGADRARAMLLTSRPDDFGIEGKLWGWQQVQSLLWHCLHKEVSRWTVRRYLIDWGIQPARPLERLLRVDPVHAEHWLAKKYNFIKSQARRSNAMVYFLESTQVDFDGGTIELWWLVGGRGDWFFLVCQDQTSEDLVCFLRSVKDHFSYNVQLITTGAMRRDARLENWLKRNAKRLQLKEIPSD